ncbi:hypothetical protein ACTAQI_08870 [Pseudarthrobacter sp. alpha12b]
MKTMGNRCVMLLLGLAALLQLQMRRAVRPRRLQGAQRDGTRNNSRVFPAGASDDAERGDVPGWVMITLMSAVLVAALLALAGPALEAMFNQAMDKVGN